MTSRDDEPGQSLLDACRAGDREALGRLFDVCRDRVYSTALRVSGDPAAAADISQDVFVKVFARLPQFDGRSAFTTWLYRIVVNTAIDHQRSARRDVPLEEAMTARAALQVDQYTRVERRRRIEAALGSLPDALRAAVVLRHIEGLSYAEIAAVLDVTTGTVASRLSRAHARLAGLLADLAAEDA